MFLVSPVFASSLHPRITIDASIPYANSASLEMQQSCCAAVRTARQNDSPPTGEVHSWWKVAHPATAYIEQRDCTKTLI
jgi:hypothetical protein